MNRRSFLMGSTALVAGAALPHPNVPTGGEVNEALSYVTVEDAQLYATRYVSQPIGIALQTRKAGEMVSVLLNDMGYTSHLRIDRDVYAGSVVTNDDSSLWIGKSDQEILDDIDRAFRGPMTMVQGPTPGKVVLDIETRSFDKFPWRIDSEWPSGSK